MRRIGKSVMGRDISLYKIGFGKTKILIAGAFHANEWLTAEVLKAFYEEFNCAIKSDLVIGGVNARKLCKRATLYIVPSVNPDGVALVRQEACLDEVLAAKKIAENYPEIPFPDGWKTNIRGVDLNLNFPAGWETARKIKAEMGFSSPAPRDFPGKHPLSEPESIAIAKLTKKICPDMILAFHSQGKIIYWKYLDIDVTGAWDIATKMSEASGYVAEETPYASGHAGFKDWFILKFGRPGFTIEVGEGENPLPAQEFDEIYRESRAIIISAIESSIQPL